MKSFLWLGSSFVGLAVISAAACSGGVTSEAGGAGAGGPGAGGATSASTSGSTSGTTASSAAGGGEGSTSSASAGSSSTSGSGGAGGGSGGDCNPACGFGLICCNGVCVNPGNDIKNCGACGTTCDGLFPYCDNGKCGTAPCDQGTICNGTSGCCGSECCMPGMLCCVVPAGPIGPPKCVKPNDKGTCEPGCPGCVCASPDTPIATPSGDRAIADLAVGDFIYSVDGGRVVVAPVVQVNRAPVTKHSVVHVSLANGRQIEISPAHPTGDGRTFGDLRPGDTLHGAQVTDAFIVPYGHDFTYDVLPASDTGAYFAGGALIGSTLAKQPALAPDASFVSP